MSSTSWLGFWCLPWLPTASTSLKTRLSTFSTTWKMEIKEYMMMTSALSIRAGPVALQISSQSPKQEKLVIFSPFNLPNWANRRLLREEQPQRYQIRVIQELPPWHKKGLHPNGLWQLPQNYADPWASWSDILPVHRWGDIQSEHFDPEHFPIIQPKGFIVALSQGSIDFKQNQTLYIFDGYGKVWECMFEKTWQCSPENTVIMAFNRDSCPVDYPIVCEWQARRIFIPSSGFFQPGRALVPISWKY